MCALLCGVHIVMMGAFTRRTDAWLLAGSQVMICGVVSVGGHRIPAARRTAFRMPWPAAVALAGRGPTALSGDGLDRVRLLGTGGRANAAGPAEAAVLFCLEPVAAALLSVVWLKEPMTAQQVLGGALIVVAMIVAEALPYMFRAITVPDTRP